MDMNCCIARMLPRQAELVSEWTGLPGEEKCKALWSVQHTFTSLSMTSVYNASDLPVVGGGWGELCDDSFVCCRRGRQCGRHGGATGDSHSIWHQLHKQGRSSSGSLSISLSLPLSLSPSPSPSPPLPSHPIPSTVTPLPSLPWVHCT